MCGKSCRIPIVEIIYNYDMERRDEGQTKSKKRNRRLLYI